MTFYAPPPADPFVYHTTQQLADGWHATVIVRATRMELIHKHPFRTQAAAERLAAKVQAHVLNDGQLWLKCWTTQRI